MKTNITLSIDQEIAEKLKAETNYSDLVNEQLKGYYAVKTSENKEILRLNLAKTKQILKENRKKRRELEAALLKIDKKHKLFKRKLLSKSKMIEEIKKRRASEAQNKNRSIKYYETAEKEADRICKGVV